MKKYNEITKIPTTEAWRMIHGWRAIHGIRNPVVCFKEDLRTHPSPP